MHTGIRMKDRATREKEDAAKVARVEKQMVPLSLLQLTLPTQPPPTATAATVETLPQPGQLANQEGQAVSVSITPAVAPQPIQAAVVVVGSMEQVGGVNLICI